MAAVKNWSDLPFVVSVFTFDLIHLAVRIVNLKRYMALPNRYTQEEATLSEELETGEKLIWTGQPYQGLRFSWFDLYAVPFGLFFFGFAIVWSILAFRGAPPFALFGIPFILVGAYMAFGRFIIEAKQRARTYYAITDRRIIIVTGLFTRTVRSLDLSTLQNVSVSEKKNGRGTVEFAGKTGFERLFGQFGGFGSFGYNAMDSSSFQLIDNSRAVYNLVRDAKRALSSV